MKANLLDALSPISIRPTMASSSLFAADSRAVAFATLGRLTFAIAMTAFGIQHLVYAAFAYGLGPPWFPGRPLEAYLTGAALVIAGAAIVSNKRSQAAAGLLGVMMLLLFLFLHVPRLIEKPLDPGVRTSAFEILTMCGAAMVLIRILPSERPPSDAWLLATDRIAKAGTLIFALGMVVFGVAHFQYATFIAGLIPEWIPGHLFWAYLTGMVFIVGAVSIASRRQVPPAMAALASMFFLWVLVLHGPRVAASPGKGNEWTSLFVAFTMGGAACIMGAIDRFVSRGSTSRP